MKYLYTQSRLLSLTLILLTSHFSMAMTVAPEFKGEELKIETQLRELFEVSKKVNSADNQEKNSARLKIDNAVDWEKITMDCLGKSSKVPTASQKKEFQSLLKEVISKTAYSRLDKFWKGATYSFDKIVIQKNLVQTSAKFNVSNEIFALDYYLIKKNNQWKIYDVAYEEIRYSENISEQIQAFLLENKAKGFDHLIEKLKKKKQEM